MKCKLLFAFASVAFLAGCATKPDPLPLPPPRADLCTHYTSWLMSPPAAAVETIGNLRAHASNQAAHYEKCLIPEHESKLNTTKASGGPR